MTEEEKIFAGKFLSYHLHLPLFFWWYVRGSSLRKGGAGAAGRRPPLWGSAAAEYGCLMTGQENERGAPYSNFETNCPKEGGGVTD
mgnify:CR=1 FL=1